MPSPTSKQASPSSTEIAFTASSKAKADKASFLDLPPEIRNRIYALSLIDDEKMCMWRYRTLPRLAHVSRQVRGESTPILYANNNFYLTSRGLACFIKHVPSRGLENIKSVTLDDNIALMFEGKPYQGTRWEVMLRYQKVVNVVLAKEGKELLKPDAIFLNVPTDPDWMSDPKQVWTRMELDKAFEGRGMWRLSGHPF